MQVLQFVHGIVAPLADVPVAELALQIYLQAAYSASEVAHLEMIAYEFMEQVWFLTLHLKLHTHGLWVHNTGMLSEL
jgi:hypothetical protein